MKSLLSFVSVFLFIPSAWAATLDRVACVIDDQVITLSEVEERATALKAQSPHAPKPILMREAAEDLISERLLDKELKALSIDVGASELQLAIDDVVRQNKLPSEEALQAAVERQGLGWLEYKDSLRRQLAQMKLINLKVRSQVKVSEDEVKRRYAELTAADKGEEEVHASHVLVMLEQDASQELVEAAMERATELAAKARKGTDFASLASESSDGPSKIDGGDLGWFRRGEMVRELEQAAFALSPGQISDPVRTRFGFHVIKLEGRREIPPRPLEELAGQIREGLFREEMSRQTERFLTSLKKDSLIEYPMEELAPDSVVSPSTTRR